MKLTVDVVKDLCNRAQFTVIISEFAEYVLRAGEYCVANNSMLILPSINLNSIGFGELALPGHPSR